MDDMYGNCSGQYGQFVDPTNSVRTFLCTGEDMPSPITVQSEYDPVLVDSSSAQEKNMKDVIVAK